MKVLSYNMWGRFGPFVERWAYAAKALPPLDADILCLQEAGFEEGLDRVAAATQTRILIADYNSTGLAVLSRLPSRANKLIKYKMRSHVEDYSRKLEGVWIEDKKGGDFLLTNTHLSWKPGDDATRAAQAKELLDWAAAKDMPTLMCGDFNCEYGSEPMKLLRKDYKDLMKGARDEKKPTWDNANPFIQTHREHFPDRRIDLMLANGAFLKKRLLKDIRIVLREPNAQGLRVSDHYGVLAEFK